MQRTQWDEIGQAEDGRVPKFSGRAEARPYYLSGQAFMGMPGSGGFGAGGAPEIPER